MIAIDTYIIDGLVKVVRGMVGSKIRDGIRTRMRERRYAIVQRKRICLEFFEVHTFLEKSHKYTTADQILLLTGYAMVANNK